MKTVVKRDTKETQIKVELWTNSTEPAKVETGLPFMDHMVATLARYAGLGLHLTCKWDLEHHGMEDVAIALGTAVQRLVPERANRYGERTIPMDDALVQACLDIGGRFFYRGPLCHRMYDHWMRSFAEHSRMTLHLRILRGRDPHHVTEAAFKAVGMALRDAMTEGPAALSTKGSVKWEIE